MKLLFVVQRYGPQVPGGAEAYCREMAEHAAARGHRVEALASCARDYLTWGDAFPAGTTEENGVIVHRRPVSRERNLHAFGMLNRLLSAAPAEAAPFLQEQWAHRQGPEIAGLDVWLDDNAGRFDVANFVTYAYTSSNAGLPVAARHVPTVLHPTAHDEPAFSLRFFDRMLKATSGFAFLTPEEQHLFERRFPSPAPASVIGVGSDLDLPRDGGARLRREHGLGDVPYLLFLGRVDPAKGSDEALRFFAAYKERNPSPLKLVIVGEPVVELTSHPDVICTGFVDEATKASALSGSLALLQPSYFESFSMALTESWAVERPALVQAACEVLDGQVRRSGGGIPYRGYGEFEAAVDMLVEQPDLADALGRAGRRYVETHYGWPQVMQAYEELLDCVLDRSAANDVSRRSTTVRSLA